MHNSAKLRICLAILAAVVATISSNALAGKERKFLTCESQCAKRVPPHGSYFPHLPANRTSDASSAFVAIMYSVAADGETENVRIMTQYGPPEFSENSIKEISRRHFQPATEGGRPIAFHGMITTNFFNRASNIRSNPPEYSSAMALADSGKPDEALKLLETNRLYANRNISYYFMDAFAEAAIYWEEKDFTRALYYARIANLAEGGFLTGDAYGRAIHLEFLAAAASGQYAEALTVYDQLDDKKATTPEESKLAADLESRIADGKPVQVRGWIHDSSLGGAWSHELFRRKFEFYSIKGKLDHFELMCDGRKMTSAINESTAWVVPASWSICTIYVLGDTDTTFEFYEQ
jgi:hypothetical protein